MGNFEWKQGRRTYVGARGESIIDYGIVNEEAWEEIESFKVGERVESDHMPLEIKIKGKEQEYEKQERRNERKEIEKRIWDEEGIQRYRSRLEKKKFEVKEDIEAMIAELSNLIVEATEKRKIYIWQGRNNGCNEECSELKRKAREKLGKWKNNKGRKEEYLKARENYRRKWEERKREKREEEEEKTIKALKTEEV
ncbi:hypothetical protein Zmor_015436 [Zophobas morio]|uniref:Endonuclease/exonuclease/phosphatase domain-containing protein n=1 Tax=Zophobas morio TaxID=2755281 RepID=A0AA38IM52_9CUCU|nr:hypothetical protein Zmor_015436 [Zophobas morio]